MTTSRSRLLLWTLLVAYLAWGAFYVQRTSFAFQGQRVFCLWDDAMISMQYARNLVEGHGLIWNIGGERVQGISNLGVTLVMALIHLFPLGDHRTSLVFQLLNLATLGAVLVLVASLARRLFPAEENDAVAIGAALATALCAPLAVWSLLGSDMGFVTLWLLLGVHGLAGVSRDGTGWPPGLFLGLAPGLLLRPDSFLLYGLLLAAAWMMPGGRRRAVTGLVVGAGFIGGWVLFSQLYYGDPLPNTYYLKATGQPRMLMIRSGLEQLWNGTPESGGWLPRLTPALLLALPTVWHERKRPVVVLCAALIALTFAYSIWVGGDWSFPWGIRFIVPTLPLLAILTAAGAYRISLRLAGGKDGTRRAAIVTVTLAVLAGVLLNPSKAGREWFNPSVISPHAEFNRDNYLFARYLERYTDPTTTLGAHWGGVPPYFSRRFAIDVLGKSDRHIAHMTVDRFKPGHSKWDWDYVLSERKPDIFRAPSRGLDGRSDFLRDYVQVLKGESNSFYMRRESLGKLFDTNVVLVDLVTGERSRHAP